MPTGNGEVSQGTPDQIFISYAREDKSRIAPLISLLESQGWDVWWDADITPGTNYDQVIESAIESASCLVVVWSVNSVKSDWVFNEAALGKEHGKLIPVAIDDVRAPLEFRRVQCAQLLNAESDPAHPEVDKFLTAVRAAIAATTGTGPAPTATVRSAAPSPPAEAAATPAPVSGGPKRRVALVAAAVLAVAATAMAYTILGPNGGPDVDPADETEPPFGHAATALQQVTDAYSERLGDEVGDPVKTSISMLPLENGFMFWRETDVPVLIHVCSENNGTELALSSHRVATMNTEEAEAAAKSRDPGSTYFEPYDGGFVRVWLATEEGRNLGSPLAKETWTDKQYTTWTQNFRNGFVIGPFDAFIGSQGKFDPAIPVVWALIQGDGSCVSRAAAR